MGALFSNLEIASSMAILASFLRNLRWGIANGLGGAAAFSGIVLIISLLRGSTQFVQYGATTWSIIGSYFAAGLIAGVVLGLLRPLAKYWLGTLITATLCSICVVGAIGYAMDGQLDVEMALTLGAMYGVMVSVIYWWHKRKRAI